MEARGIDPTGLRSVHPIVGADLLKALYYDRERAALRPNLVFVDPNGAVVFETNEVGLKGDPLDRQRKLAVIWGDSVVFGRGRGWPCLLDRLAAGYQFLNGGLEGDLYKNILRRASEFNRRHQVEVALNALMLGWHPFVPSPPTSRRPRLSFAKLRQRPRPGNKGIRADLTSFLERTPNTVVLTVPTALNPLIVDRDLSSFLVEGDENTAFRFVGDAPYQMAGQRQAMNTSSSGTRFPAKSVVSSAFGWSTFLPLSIAKNGSTFASISST